MSTLPQLAEQPGHGLRYAANCSLLFTEVPLLERPALARAAGFNAVEFWWPFTDATPTATQVGAFVTAVRNAGVRLVGLNFYAGDLAGDDCGLVSLPARAGEFRDSVAVAVQIGEELGVEVFNALYGNRLPAVSAAEQDRVAEDNLSHAAIAVGGFGGRVLLEPVSGPKPYPLRRAVDVLAVIDRIRRAAGAQLGFLCDLYHLAENGEDLNEVIAQHGSRVTHVQIADAPGRGEPGSGQLDLQRHLGDLEEACYHSWVSLEYRPTTSTAGSLAWLEHNRRGAASAPPRSAP